MAGTSAKPAEGSHAEPWEGQSRHGGRAAGKSSFRWFVIFLLFYITVANYTPTLREPEGIACQTG